MKLKINGNILDKYSNLIVSLIYASACSVFSFDLYFDPWNKLHREIMLPGAYNEAVIISDSGEVLITGILLSVSFKDSAKRSLVSISGYSKTGVLQDCNYLEDGNGNIVFPKQANGKNLYSIAQDICGALGLNVITVGNVMSDISSPFAEAQPDDGDSCLDYLNDIAKKKNIIISHDELGNLVLTRAMDAQALFDFTSGMPGIEFSLNFDGQQMHSSITAKIQGGTSQTVMNPYVQLKSHINYTQGASQGLERTAPKMTGKKQYDKAYRPTAFVQTQGDDNDTDDTAQQALAKELKAIQITGKMTGWELAGKIVRPNNFHTITSPNMYLFNKTKLFVERVDFSGDERQETCIMSYVVPEVYNGQLPVNIFTANGNNTNYKDKPVDEDLPNQIVFTKFSLQNNIDL